MFKSIAFKKVRLQCINADASGMCIFFLIEGEQKSPPNPTCSTPEVESK